MEAEAARLKEEAEAVRIASLERKVESVRARLDASASVEFSPTRADRTSGGGDDDTDDVSDGAVSDNGAVLLRAASERRGRGGVPPTTHRRRRVGRAAPRRYPRGKHR